jgi:hypothetical protein
MKGGTRLSIVGMTLLLLALAGCGRGFFQFGERAPWRHDAEVACLKSGEVKLGTGIVQVEPIDGPGMCGADFPLKVSEVGEATPLVGYSDELRPPGAIPRASSQMPRWPLNEPRYASASVQSETIERGNMRWISGPPGIQSPQGTTSPQSAGQPLSINPPGLGSARDDAIAERSLDTVPGTAPRQQLAPPLGAARAPVNASTFPVALSPTATLACPLVSALDRWVSEGVQPSALHWFGTPVVKMQQISAYSCRGMVGSGTSTISEHAFGNALDIAGFTLADGRKITVKDGWHGTPEEQGFLHDVQLYACETFVTVLAPGYNASHHDHIHVDLMRRESGNRPCRPEAIRGEVVAAKARAHYASQRREPAFTGSIGARNSKTAVAALPGEDGYVDDEPENRKKRLNIR